LPTGGRGMKKYRIEMYGEIYYEKTKDDVINFLMGIINQTNGTNIKIIWPDKSHIEYEGFE
jgi:hypothetical protein